MPVAEQLPAQPVKVEPVAEVVVSVTEVLLLKEAEQVEPQLIPSGSEVTVPEPVPALEMVRVWVGILISTADHPARQTLPP